MVRSDAQAYGEHWADVYDEFVQHRLDTDSTVEFLAGLAGQGPVLELGVGTGRFALVFVVYNTIFSLLTQEDQVRCFANVARRLADDGAFVVEAFVPDLGRFDRGQRTQTSEISVDRVVLEVSRHRGAQQRITSQRVVLRQNGTSLYPVELRYAWPSELDLMARLAGLRLRERYGGWHGEPFTDHSQAHVSVYDRA